MARQAPKTFGEVLLEFPAFRHVARCAGCWLVCLLGVHAAIAEETETKPAARDRVNMTMNVTNGSVLAGLSQITVTVCQADTGIDGVLVHLRELSRSKEISCIAKLSPPTNSNRCDNELNWTATIPRLRDGRYEVSAQALLDEDSPAVSTSRNIVIDGTAPDISFFPLHDQQPIADFSEVGGEIDEVAAIEFSICQVNDTIDQKIYWNGKTWSTNRNDPAIRMRAGSVGDFWFSSTETALPKSAEIPAGNYLISVFAFDRAGNEGRAAVTVVKKFLPFSAKVESRPLEE
jgi:hypothetical protein